MSQCIPSSHADLELCPSTDPGAQATWVSLQEGGSPYYSTPCDEGAAGSLARCETFEYLRVKTISSCGDPLCYAKVKIRNGTIAWVPDHTLGRNDSMLGLPANPVCTGAGNLQPACCYLCNMQTMCSSANVDTDRDASTLQIHAKA